jgi:hypothetical protein
MADPLASGFSERLILRSEDVEGTPVPEVLETPSDEDLRTLRSPVPDSSFVTIALPMREMPPDAFPFTAVKPPAPNPPAVCCESRLSNGRRFSPLRES